MAESRFSVLVVEDYPNWRELLTELLEDEFDVVAVTNYDEALTALAQQSTPFHVVVTDLRLDDRDIADEGGLRLVQHLQNRKETTKVIVVTGYPTFETQEKAYQQLHVYKYLLKNPGNNKAFDYHAFRQHVRDAAAEAEQEQRAFAFVLMPFADEFRMLYDEIIKKTIEGHGLACKRADDFYLPVPIIDDILRGIHDAAFVVADLSDKNPNVLYEVGLAHAMGQTTLLITQRIADVPPSLRHLRHIIYHNRPGARELADGLVAALTDLKKNGYVANSILPDRSTAVDPRSCMVLIDADDQQSHLAYKEIVEPVAHEFNLQCTTIQNIFATERVMEETQRRVRQAALVVADLSTKDPNVFYLTGLSHGWGKQVVLLADDLSAVPFDLRDRSCMVRATGSFAEGEHSKAQLRQIINQLMTSTKLVSDLLDQGNLSDAIEHLKNADEQIIGVNNLKQIAWLQRALDVSRAVCRVHTPGGKGSGFLVSPNLVMTNNHVIPNAEIAAQTVVEFNYQLGIEQDQQLTHRYHLDSSRFHTNSELDYTLVGVLPAADKPDLSQWGYLILNANADPVSGEHVSIIQHPNGGPKQIVLTANQVVNLWQYRLQYTTDTMPGSSGSPVFNDSWEVIAIHHAGGNLRTNDKGDSRFINEGILMSAIKADAGALWPGT